MMLTTRRGEVLRLIVNEYVVTGTPVASETLTRRHGLGVSPATVRNDMAELEEAGYISRPHISAGAVPQDKGYRYYVDSLPAEVEMSPAEQRLIRHQFAQVGPELERWLGLAAAMLARLAHNLALVTHPRVYNPRLKRLGLIALRPTLALLVAVLHQARMRQLPLPLEEAASQEELDRAAHHLTALYQGLTRQEIQAREASLSSLEARALDACLGLMAEEEAEYYETPLIEGLGELFGQPEFTLAEKVIELVEIARGRLRYLLPQLLVEGPVRVIIGRENPEEALRSLSLVLAPYGVGGQFQGVLGVLGPTRMPYQRSISATRYLSSLLNEAIMHYYG